MRPDTTKRNIWAQLGISACALLLPPMALGAAVYSLLPARNESATRTTAGTVADVKMPTPQSRVETAYSWLAGDYSGSTAQATEPVAGHPAPLAESRSLVTSGRRAPAGKAAKDMARVAGPAQITDVVPPAGAPTSTDSDSAPTTGSIDQDPFRSGTAAVSTSLLPRALVPPGRTSSQILLPRMPAADMAATQIPAAPPPPAESATAQVPSPAGPPAAESPPASSTPRRHARSSYLAHLTRRNGAHAEARGETRDARRNTEPQQAFSLKNWLQRLGTRPRNSGG